MKTRQSMPTRRLVMFAAMIALGAALTVFAVGAALRESSQQEISQSASNTLVLAASTTVVAPTTTLTSTTSTSLPDGTSTTSTSTTVAIPLPTAVVPLQPAVTTKPKAPPKTAVDGASPTTVAAVNGLTVEMLPNVGTPPGNILRDHGKKVRDGGIPSQQWTIEGDNTAVLMQWATDAMIADGWVDTHSTDMIWTKGTAKAWFYAHINPPPPLGCYCVGLAIYLAP